MSLDLVAKYYDLLYGHLEDDLSMWLALTEAVNGPILEMGCGTGRVLLPLAQAGHTITGLDLSADALETARAKVEAAGIKEQVRLVQADMRYCGLQSNYFEFAFIPLNTLMHCHTIEEQTGTLAAIHSSLQPGGRLVIDLFHPDPALLAEADGRLYLEDEFVDEINGHTVQLYWRHEIDLARQMRHFIYLLDKIDAHGLVRRTRIPFSLRY
ncbi:MAG: class I SAM-dependent methyltransferase, partial [Anaerolineae bacterium]|nr:class I SAM-dependent methyltransferase [Anaerolineae bacterium]